ncbi:hypothetical protein NL676_014087 [Syzygium grande]|nr:hypothetical protein NL676_014087 [Syzygium grande]
MATRRRRPTLARRGSRRRALALAVGVNDLARASVVALVGLRRPLQVSWGRRRRRLAEGPSRPGRNRGPKQVGVRRPWPDLA